MKPEIHTRRYFKCPAGCDHEFIVENLLASGKDSNAGPWECAVCGRPWVITFKDGELEVTEHEGIERRRYNDFTILELPPQTESVFFKIKSMRWQPTLTPEALDKHRYYYEEHTCPVNWLGVLEVKVGKDADPHGLFRFVTSFDADAEEKEEGPRALQEKGREDSTSV